MICAPDWTGAGAACVLPAASETEAVCLPYSQSQVIAHRAPRRLFSLSTWSKTRARRRRCRRTRPPPFPYHAYCHQCWHRAPAVHRTHPVIPPSTASGCAPSLPRVAILRPLHGAGVRLRVSFCCLENGVASRMPKSAVGNRGRHTGGNPLILPTLTMCH